jgi:hypothetical protein
VDTATVTVSPTSVATTEAGVEDFVTMILDSQPQSNVLIAVSSSDVSEGTVSPPTLTFTSTNWDTTQIVTVTGQDDYIKDDSIGFTIQIGAFISADLNFNGGTVADVTATNADGAYTVQ